MVQWLKLMRLRKHQQPFVNFGLMGDAQTATTPILPRRATCTCYLRAKRRMPPLKGKKRRRTKIIETDWQDYYGSSESVKLLVEEKGRETFHREILRLCKKKAEMSYYEAKLQFESDCLLYPDQYYNEFIGCKVNRWHLLTKKKN